MFLVPITIIVVVIFPVQFIGWVALYCVHNDIVLDDIVDKLQCSMFHAKRAKNRVPVFAVNSI